MHFTGLRTSPKGEKFIRLPMDTTSTKCPPKANITPILLKKVKEKKRKRKEKKRKEKKRKEKKRKEKKRKEKKRKEKKRKENKIK